MVIKEEVDKIYSYFLAEWDNTTSVALGNEPFNSEKVSEWVRVVYSPVVSSQQTLAPVGNRTFEIIGILSVQIFTKAGTGNSRSNELTDLVLSFMEAKRISKTVVQEIDFLTIGRSENFYQVNITINLSTYLRK